MDFNSFAIGLIIGLLLGAYISAAWTYNKIYRELKELFERQGLKLKEP